MTHDMKHLDYLHIVAALDLAYVDKKDRQYGGSWKRSGGRSAWFMIVRKIDRLREMMRKPDDVHGFSLEDLDDAIGPTLEDHEPDVTVSQCIIKYLRDCYVSENIFAKIRENPSGEDGTVLAEIRDLRRYLMLVEAEMMARGVLTMGRTPPAKPIPPSATARQIAEAATAHFGDPCVHCGTPHDEVKPGPCPALVSGNHEYVSERRVPRYPVGDAGTLIVEDQQRTPEDGAQHASLAPHVVRGDYFERKNILVAHRGVFWRQRGPAMHVLEAQVTHHEMPRVLRDFYRLDHQHGWIIRIDRVPADAREFFPRLRRELNSTEFDEMPKWQHHFYVWDESANKYVIHDQFQGWAVI